MTTLAYAETSSAAAQPQTTPPLFNIVPILGMLVIFYFFMIRPQQKRAKEHKLMLEALQKGDMVVTSGGIYGTVAAVGEKTFELKIADNVKLKVLRSAVTERLNAQDSSNGKSAATPVDFK